MKHCFHGIDRAYYERVDGQPYAVMACVCGWTSGPLEGWRLAGIALDEHLHTEMGEPLT